MRRFLVALAIIMGTPAWGLDPKVAITQYGHQVWTTADGLPHNSIRAIAQTPDGYLWVATERLPLARQINPRPPTTADSTQNTPAPRTTGQ